MLFSKTKTKEFIPTFMGNDKDACPATFRVKIMSAAEMEEFSSMIRDTAKTVDFFRFGFSSCTGVCMDDGTELTDAESIINAPGLSQLVKEVADAFIDANVLGGEPKNA